MNTVELLKTSCCYQKIFFFNPQTKLIILFSFLNIVRIINITTFEEITWLQLETSQVFQWMSQGLIFILIIFVTFLIITCCKEFFLLFCNPLHDYLEFNILRLKIEIKYPKQFKIEKFQFFLSFAVLVNFPKEKKIHISV